MSSSSYSMSNRNAGSSYRHRRRYCPFPCPNSMPSVSRLSAMTSSDDDYIDAIVEEKMVASFLDDVENAEEIFPIVSSHSVDDIAYLRISMSIF